MKVMMKKFGVLAALTVLLLTSGCDVLPFGFTSIKEVSAAPANFEGKEIKLKGKVKSITQISLLGLKMYTLDDGSGEVVVIPAENEKLPAENDSVALTGTVQNVAIIGSQSLGMHIKEIKRLPTLGL